MTLLSFLIRGCAVILMTAVAPFGAGPVTAQTPAREAAAKTPSGPGSLSGVWQKRPRSEDTSAAAGSDELKNVLVTADGTPVPLQPWAQTLVDKRLKDAEAGRIFASTQTKCLPAGVPEMMLEAGPMEFVETATQFIILRQEFTFFRVVRMNAEHLKDFDPTYLGDSVGHWEGGTLVVDTIGQNDATTIRVYIPHSEAMHVVERYRRTGPDTLEIAVTIDDPKTFTKRWRIVGTLKRQNYELSEFFCENNRNVPDENNNLVVVPAK